MRHASRSTRHVVTTVLAGAPFLAVAILGASAAGASTGASTGARASAVAREIGPAKAPVPTPILPITVQLGPLTVNLSLPLDLGHLIVLQTPTSSAPSTPVTSSSSATTTRHPTSSPPSSPTSTATRPTTSHVIAAVPPATGAPPSAAPSPASTTRPAPSTPTGSATRRTHPALAPPDTSIQLLPGSTPAQLVGLLVALVAVTALGVGVVVRMSGHRGARGH